MQPSPLLHLLLLEEAHCRAAVRDFKKQTSENTISLNMRNCQQWMFITVVHKFVIIIVIIMSHLAVCLSVAMVMLE